MDRYTKTILTGILLVLISIAAKDVDLFPIAEAQQGWEIDNELAMNGSMQAVPASNGLAYICQSRYVPTSSSLAGSYGYITLSFYDGPHCVGSYLGFGRMYTEGANDGHSEPWYFLSETQALFYADATARAADTGQRVRYYACNPQVAGAALNCVKYLEFRGDPADVEDAD